jgi:hypothetical protein
MQRSLMFALAFTIAAATWLPTRSSSAATSALNLAADLPGTYGCEGTQPHGAVYRGRVDIARREDSYQVLWTLGDRQYVGIGIANQDMLAVSYFGEVPGIVLYRIERGARGPRLVGQWTTLGAEGQLFSETLTKVADGATLERAPAPRRQKQTPPSRGASTV